MDRTQEKFEDLGSSVEDLLTGLATVNSYSDYAQRAEEVSNQVDGLRSDINQARKDYRDILALKKGVADYKQYANVVLRLIDVQMEHLNSVDEYLTYLGDQFKSAESGNVVDVQAISETTQKFITGLRDLKDKTDELKDQAQKTQTDKKL